MGKKDERICVCRVVKCDGEAFARGYCAAHLRRLYKIGTTSPHIPIKRRVWGSRTIHTPEHRAWRNMRYRCNNPKCKSFKNYGGRGIKVCQRWDSYDNFLEDVGKRPTPQHSLDRIKNNKGYSPSNCRWATKSQQRCNQRQKWMFG